MVFACDVGYISIFISLPWSNQWTFQNNDFLLYKPEGYASVPDNLWFIEKKDSKKINKQIKQL